MYASNAHSSVLCACTTVKKLSRVLGRTYDAALAGSGINITQLAVLRCIDRRDGEPLVRVAEELELDRTSLYRAVTPMVRDGWVKLSEGPHGRTRTAKVTSKGQRVLAKADAGWNEIQEHLVKKFGRAAYSSLIAELYRLGDCAEDVTLDGEVSR